ncbi:DUF5666 domain-containing protein [Acidithiobacillus sp.]
MMSNRHALAVAARALVAGLGILMLSGFESGRDIPGGIGGTGIDPGGIGGTGITALGPIQRFGSIYVNGREYLLTPETRYLVDGAKRPASALHLGDLVIVQAAAFHGKTIAALVHVQHAVIGPISQTDVAAGQITVLGQTIHLNSDTLIRASGSLTLSLADLRVGNVVAVSALSQGHAQWQALRVTRIATGVALGRVPLLMRGRIEMIDSAKDRLRLGRVWLNTNEHMLQDVVVGQEMIATGSYQDGHPNVHTLRPAHLGLGSVGDRVYLVGYLHQTPQGWRSNGFLLRIGADTRFVGGSAESLHTGALAVMDGHVEKPGEVIVDRVVLGVIPVRYGIPQLMHGAEETGHRATETAIERPEIVRPEMQRPEIMRPEIMRPQIQRPQIMRPEVQRPQITRPQIQQPQMMP